ncbi:MAG: hypothetical protein ABJL54_16065 [Halioglobus sp.]
MRKIPIMLGVFIWLVLAEAASADKGQWCPSDAGMAFGLFDMWKRVGWSEAKANQAVADHGGFDDRIERYKGYAKIIWSEDYVAGDEAEKKQVIKLMTDYCLK